MVNKEFIIFIACIFSAVEIFVIFKFFSKKRYYAFIETIIAYLSILAFLYYVYYSKFPIKSGIIASVIITIMGHSFIGQYLDIYHKSKYYDRFLHLFGTFSFALFTYSIIYNVIKPFNYSRVYVSLFVITLGITIGVICEMVEFILDVFSKTPKNQHGLKDTNMDLIFDMIGATIAGIISTFIFI